MKAAPSGDLISVWSESARAELLGYLERLNSLPAFSSSPRRCQLLRYLIERKLAGDAEKLNEYAIGLDVLEKPPSFDPRMEASVRVQVSRLRRALNDYYAGEGARDPWRIELPARGYVPVIEKIAAPAPETIPEIPSEKRPSIRRVAIVAIAFVLLAVGASAYLFKFRPLAPHSIAIVPFANLSEDRGSDYFGDGIADEVTATLGRIPGLRVIARASTVRFRSSKESPREMGSLLGVQTVLEGSVQRAGDRVRVITTLNSASDGSQIWSEVFDSDGMDALALEDRIAAAVAAKLGASLQTRAHRDPAVHDLFLRGRFFATQQTPAAVLRSKELFEQGLARDPNDPECLRGMASDEVWLANMGQKSLEEANRAARELIQKAVSADPGDGMGHLMLGYTLYVDDRNWPAAEAEFRKAVALSPNSPDVRNNYGYMLLYQGRLDEAQVQFIHAREIDPLSIMPHFNMCAFYSWTRDYPHGEAECRAVLRINPKHLNARIELADMLAWEGKYAAAFQELDQARVEMVTPEVALAVRAKFLAREGKRREAADALREMDANPGPVSWAVRAGAYLEFGDRDKALAYLEKAYQEHDGNLLVVPNNPHWASVRSDPRFSALFRRILGQ
jgi:TolB-like protein/Tfp pilus assembly protein PilF